MIVLNVESFFLRRWVENLDFHGSQLNPARALGLSHASKLFLCQSIPEKELVGHRLNDDPAT